MPTFRANTAVDPSQISGAFDSIAKAFAPPSPQDVYAGAKAQETQQRVRNIAEIFAYAKNPNFDRKRFDPLAIAGGLYTPSQSYYSVDTADQRSGSNNAADNARALEQTRLQQAGENQRNANTVRGSTIASAFGPLNPGQVRPEIPANVASTIGLPPLSSAFGISKPVTKAEAEGEAFRRLPEEQQLDAAYGSTPVETIIRNGMPEIAARRRSIGGTPAPALAAPSNVGRLQAERAALPPGDPRIAEYDAAIAAEGRGATADPYRNATDVALAKRHADLVTAGASAAGMSANLDALEPLLSAVPTGALAQRKLQVAKYAADVGLQDVADGLTGGKLGQAEAANAIIQRMAPLLRVPGSGAQSDRELANFLASVPSLLNSPEGNRLIIGTLRGAAQNQQRAAEIARQAQAGTLDKFEAERQIAALASPFTRFGDPQNGAQASPQGATPQQQQQPVRVSTPDEARKLPSGTPILLPDGTVGRVP